MFKSFLRDECGAQVVEYALIIAVISIALVLALQPLFLAAGIGSFISRIASCLSGTGCA